MQCIHYLSMLVLVDQSTVSVAHREVYKVSGRKGGGGGLIFTVHYLPVLRNTFHYTLLIQNGTSLAFESF